ncbi:MAG: 3-isopropylmalate dehydratase large subunit [Rhodospirillales bacterium]|jgi:homoaconitate hydratase family protein|nr:3-isopropylmalate dehydratase large subunit [Rhodospirillales bacterium]
MHALAKIIAQHAGKSSVDPGEIVNVEPDYVMLHDRGVARVMQRFSEMGAEKVWDPSKVVVVFDHTYPAPRVQDAESQQRSRAWMKEQNITNFFPGEGICHVILPEKGFAFPGALIVGSDSHTVTNSALGCMSTGMGHSDLGSLLSIGYNWMRVPEVVRFDIQGNLKPWVTAKDIILNILKEHGEAICTYQAVEYAGPTVRSMSMDGRLTLCNLAVEIGAKSGYVAPDETTWNWMEGRRERDLCNPQTTDSDDDFAKVYEFDVSDLEPMVALPHDLSKVEPASSLSSVKIDEAVLGTCTGGRLEDFQEAANVLRGKKISPDTRLIVNPGSTEVFLQANKEGLIDDLVRAGAQIGTAGCGPCSGCQLGMLGGKEIAITSSSRNFAGRIGSPDSELYVASPATVAASAIAGCIVPPEEIMSKGGTS